MTDPEAVLDGLDDEQRLVATSLQGPIRVLAGAGTGKTRAVTHRIAYGVLTGAFNPQRLLAVTFTARAAAELRTRLRDLGAGAVQARTFHSAALRQLQYFWPQAVGGNLPSLLEHKAGLISEAARRLRLSADRTAVRDLASEIEWAKVSMLTPETYPEAAQGRGTPGGFDALSVSRVFQSYEDLKTDRSQIDFEDVLLLTVGILDEDQHVAAAVREQYRHFVVDEYQDVSPLQQRLLDLWLGGRQELCVVGDASQTIYSFTGATSRHLHEFDQRYPGAQTIRLIRDYRSTPQVVQLANRLLAARQPAGRAADAAWAEPLRLIAQRPAGPEPVFLPCNDDEAEARAVAAAIKQLIEKESVPPAQIAILFRTNGQSEAYEQALSTAGIGYQLRGGERFFARREVRDAMLSLRAAARAEQAPAGSADGDADPETTMPQQVRDVLASIGYSAEPPAGSGATRERWESLAALVGLADELDSARGPGVTLDAFVAELQERSQAQHAPTVQGVTLASLHSAKGLEWDAVFLVGLSEGLMPISFADSPQAVDEERRLLYVGITRARERLHLSWSGSRTPGGRAHRQPSRFLEGLSSNRLPDGRGGRASTGPKTARRTQRAKTPALCRVCSGPLSTAAERKIGRCDNCPPSYREETFEALRSWRLEESKQRQLPAFMIFTDATLIAIAEQAPGDLAELSTVAGVGPGKRDKYGAAVLQVLAEQAGSQ